MNTYYWPFIGDFRQPLYMTVLDRLDCNLVVYSLSVPWVLLFEFLLLKGYTHRVCVGWEGHPCVLEVYY